MITVVGPRVYAGTEAFPTRAFPLRTRVGYCHHRYYEGQPASHISVCLLDTMVGEDLLNVMVWLGRPPWSPRPPPAVYSAADEELARLRLPDEVGSNA